MLQFLFNLLKPLFAANKRTASFCGHKLFKEMEDTSKGIDLHIRNNYCVSNVTKTLLFIFKILYLIIGMQFNFYYYLLPDVHEIYLFKIWFSISTSSCKQFVFVIFLIRCRICNFSCILIKFRAYMQKKSTYKTLFSENV